jgi:hypothetical protein
MRILLRFLAQDFSRKHRLPAFEDRLDVNLGQFVPALEGDWDYVRREKRQ